MSTRSKIFIPLHLNIQKFYQRRALKWISSYVLRGTKGLELKVRGNLVHGERFNVFLSDLDLALVFSGTDQDVKLATLRLENLRRILRFLGELEIYSIQEWNLKLRTEREFSEQLNFVRNLRKIRWQENAQGSAKSSYHRYKARMSIRKCIEQLIPSLSGTQKIQVKASGNLIGLSELINQRIHEIFPEVPGIRFDWIKHRPIEPWYSYYFDCRFGEDLKLDPSALVKLISVTPPGHDRVQVLEDWVEKLRMVNPEISLLYRSFCAYEWVICKSVSRLESALSVPLSSDIIRMRGQWLDRLEKISIPASTFPSNSISP